jgi:HAMP domain-containing protein
MTESGSSRLQTPTERLRSGVEFLLLFAVPALVLFWAWLQMIIVWESSRGRALKETLDQEIRLLLFRSAPQEVFQSGFYRLLRFAQKHQYAPEKFSGVPPVFPGIMPVQVALFSGPETLSSPEWSPLRSRAVYLKFWRETCKTPPTQIFAKMYQATFGTAFHTQFVQKFPAILFEVPQASGTGLFLLSINRQQKGLLAFAPNVPSTFALARQALSNQRSSVFWALHSRRQNTWARIGRGPRHYQKVMKNLEEQNGGTMLEKGFLCRVMVHPDGFSIMAARPFIDYSHRYIMISSVVFIGFLLWLSGVWLRSKGAILSRIRIFPRILLIFFCGISVPLAFLGYSGLTAYRERAQVLQQQLQSSNIEKLRAMDAGYITYENWLLRFYRQLRDSPGLRTGNPDLFRRIFTYASRKKVGVAIEARDQNSRILATSQRNPEAEKVLALFYQNALQRYLDVPLPPLTPLEKIAKDILLSPQIGLREMIDFPDALKEASFGRNPLLWYWDYFRPTPDQPVATIGYLTNLHLIHLNYIRRLRQKHTWTFYKNLWYWHPNLPPSQLQAMVAQALLSRQPVHQVITLRGRPRLATAVPGSRSGRFCFVTLADLAPVSQGLTELHRMLVLVGALTTGLFFLLATLLSRSLMTPVRELATGVVHLENREFTHQVPDLGRDELGRLGHAFNSLMTDLHELDLGSRLQKSLVPLSPPHVPGYEIYLYYQPTSDLGGDFVEVFPRPDGTVLLGITDVTGHGIPAALATAMAKAVFHWSARETQPLPVLLDRLHYTVVQTLKRKLLMTAFTAILDPRTHVLQWAPAGHPYPLLRASGGRITEIGRPSKPVGGPGKTNWFVDELAFEAGSMLVLYTDGLIEARNAREDCYGYQRLTALLSTSVEASPREWADRILRDLQMFQGANKPDDDIAILLIKRRAND